MKYNFDEVVCRDDTNAFKYDLRKAVFGRGDVIPLWVADMDFRTAQPVIDAVEKAAHLGVYGYTMTPERFFNAAMDWQKRRHGREIEPTLLSWSQGVISSLAACIELFTPVGGAVLIQPPVYHVFRSVITGCDRRVLEAPLTEQDGSWQVNWEDFEDKLRRSDMFVLCNPHNPLGKVWNETDLRRMAELCLRHRVLMVSDEIHCDLLFHGKRHIPVANLSPEIAANTITLFAATKTFNLAGLQSSLAVFPNLRMKQSFDHWWGRWHISFNNPLALPAVTAAFEQGDEWLDQLLEYLDGNMTYVADYCRARIPKIKTSAPDATYLMWLDCRGLNLDCDDLRDFMVHKAGIGLNEGRAFGPGGEGFMRLNAACPRSVLEEAMKRLEAAVNEL